jgi:nitric oxide reductase NorD protein
MQKRQTPGMGPLNPSKPRFDAEQAVATGFGKILDFDLQFLIWSGVDKALRWFSRDPAERRREKAAVALDDPRERLQTMARALSGMPLLVRPTSALPGTDGRHLLLPQQAAWFEDEVDNRRGLLLLTVILAEVARLGIHGGSDRLPPSDPAAWADGVLLSYPGLHAERLRHLEVEAARRAHDSEAVPALAFRFLERHHGLLAPGDATGETPEAIDGSEAEAPIQESVTRTTVDKEDQEANTLMHNFEKVETLDEYKGIARDFDGEDQLEDQLEAMQELNLTEVIRVDETVHSVYRAELLMIDGIGDMAAEATGGIPYDEWDSKKRAYRKDWCRVFPSKADARDPDWAPQRLPELSETIRHLKKRLEKVISTTEQVRRQPDGPEVDLDAAIRNRVRLHLKEPPLTNLYLDRKRRCRDLAVLVLVDLSLSTDAHVEGKRVLDVAMDSMLVMAEVFAHYGDQVEVAGFYSHTRNQVHYQTLKRFDEPWAPLKAAIGALEPRGYTRIGPALRHATAQLLKAKAKHRVLLVLSDGKPSDFDRYEGRYGIGDIRQAIREAESRGVHVHALAIDKQARDYLPQMLGSQRFAIVRHPGDLPEALGTFFMKLLRR